MRKWILFTTMVGMLLLYTGIALERKIALVFHDIGYVFDVQQNLILGMRDRIDNLESIIPGLIGVKPGEAMFYLMPWPDGLDEQGNNKPFRGKNGKIRWLMYYERLDDSDEVPQIITIKKGDKK